MFQFSLIALAFVIATPVAFADAPPECTTPCPVGPTVTSGANSAEAVQADVQSLTSEIKRLKARVRTLERQPQAPVTDLSEIERRLAYLEVTLAGLDLEAVRAELETLDGRLDSLETRVTALETKVTAAEGVIGDHELRISALETADTVVMPRLVTFAASVGASGFAANGHDVVSDDMVFHASPSAGGAFDLSAGILIRPKELPLYFGASVAPRLSFDEGYGGSMIARIGGTIGPAKGIELGLIGGVDFFHDPNMQAPDWMPDPTRQSWRGIVGGEFNYLFWRSDVGQEVGLGIETSVLPGREIEGRVLGALKVRF